MLSSNERFKMILPPVPDDANKYSRGSVVVLAGSVRFPGAAVLAAVAAARTGAGYTTLVIPQSAAPIAQMHLCSIPVVPAPESEGAFVEKSARAALDVLSHTDALIVGPGLTVTRGTKDFMIALLKSATAPLLIDADGLNALAQTASGIDTLRAYTANKASVILTPHTGELKRLAYAADIEADAESLAKATGAIVVAKGSTTIITDGAIIIASRYGTSALAKAGTGDVLSGIIGSLAAQGVAPLLAAELGVYIHSQSGCRAQQEFGLRSIIAEDLLEQIPSVFKELES